MFFEEDFFEPQRAQRAQREKQNSRLIFIETLVGWASSPP
jgi:hypothetical protein